MDTGINLEEKKLIDVLNNYGESYGTVSNLAQIYYEKGQKAKAYYYYTKALELCEDAKSKLKIKEKIISLEDKEVLQYMKRKKVLIIAHIFPPLGGSGVQRTLKFVKYLRQFNYEPIIVTVGKVVTPYLMDESLQEEIPNELEIIRVDEPTGGNNYDINYLIQLYRDMVNDSSLMNQYTSFLDKDDNRTQYNYYSMPDTTSFWGTRVLEQINELVDFDRIDAIYSTSGPYTDHMIGYGLKKNYKKPWIADFRDEWTNNPYIEYSDYDLFFKMMRGMERSIVNTCDRLLTVSSISRENYMNIFNADSDKVRSITNGYDEEDFKNIEVSKEKNHKFTVAHNGLFYLEITPETFLEAINNLIKDKKIEKEKVKVIFSYTENQEKWQQYINDNAMGDMIEFKAYMGHEESIQSAINSDMLLLVLGHGEKKKSVYTGKVFEYLRMRRTILALVPKGSLVDNLMEETKSGKAIEFYDVKAIENYILERYTQWEVEKNNELINNENIEKYERRNLTQKLAQILDELIPF